MKLLINFLFFLLLANSFAQNNFDKVLRTYVDKDGNVNYKALSKNQNDLNVYLAWLESTAPQKSWSANKEKAFWINAYNAYTLKIILNNYPIESITKISNNGKTAWKTPFVKVAGKTHTLDEVEHEILRKKFKDPRIHVAVNCASVSCPKLANFAFTESDIEASLDKLMKDFINDDSRNKLTQKKVQVSEIFNWFKDDFTQEGSLIDYLNKYANITINKKAKVKFLPYNWGLNGK